MKAVAARLVEHGKLLDVAEVDLPAPGGDEAGSRCGTAG